MKGYGKARRVQARIASKESVREFGKTGIGAAGSTGVPRINGADHN
jgi:hypothetical protein